MTIHADYIGGEHANYRKWYFAAQLDLDDAIGKVQNPGLARAASMANRGRNAVALLPSCKRPVPSRFRPLRLDGAMPCSR